MADRPGKPPKKEYDGAWSEEVDFETYFELHNRIAMRETGFQLLYIVVGFITVSLLVIEYLYGISEFFGI